ncbi:MAG: ankyrin repeat domain-containing protein [Verrucomicrobiota bacterium]|jgi:ankyrin repeat protein|nr:ankyrin repeat domain-containing protein [Verrucomicrobiota bacterium]MDP6252438.1 ankyrin repeat domain-containing protein [Verrucomicrobiota bacterium]
MNSTVIILVLLVLLALLILVIILLLDQRRNPENISFLEAGNAVDPTTDGEEAPISIHESCKTGNMMELNQWLQRRQGRDSLGIDLNQKDENGYAPLHYACENGHEEAVRKLLDHNAKVNLLSSATLMSPMACLVLGRLDNKLSEPELVRIIGVLRKAGGDINPTSEEAVPPIKAVIARGNMELLDFFVSLHVHIFVEDSDKRTMLHHIALNPNANSLAITEFLVERGLEVNAQDSDGNTPLHLALSPFQRDVAKYLIESGADPEINNWKGMSPHTMVQQDIINFLSHS